MILRPYELYKKGPAVFSITTSVSHMEKVSTITKLAGAKYLRGRGSLALVFQKKLGSRSLALGVESKFKKLSKARKEELVRDDTRIDEIIKQAGA